MMRNVILSVLVFQTVVYADAGAAQVIPLSGSDLAEIGRNLQNYDKGSLSYDDLFRPEPHEACERLAAYYFGRSNALTLKMKLPVSRSLGATDHYKEAINLATEYITIYTNDWRGWRVVGLSKWLLKDYNGAINALTNAASLGDEENYAALGTAAVTAGRLDVLDRFAPAMIKRKNSSTIEEDEKLDIAIVLAGYANKAKRPEVVLEALRGISAKQIVSRKFLRMLILDSCDIFKGDEEVAALCARLRADPAWLAAAEDEQR